MNTGSALCPGCDSALPAFACGTPAPAPCPFCAQSIQVEVFPAMFKPPAAGRVGETIVEEGLSSCFYHEQKKAVVPCDGCGRFLCALCDVELNDRHLCPVCLRAGLSKGRLTTLENHRVLFDNAALTLAVGPMVLFPLIFFTIMTAPAAIICAIVSWFRPSSIIPRTRWRAYTAIIVAVLQLAAWGYLFVESSDAFGFGG